MRGPIEAWRRRRRTQRTFKREPCELAKQVEEATDDPSFKAFVRHRFWRPFDYSVRSSFRYGYAYVGLTLITIAAGLASSGLATSSWEGRDLVIAGLGLLVAIATTLNRLWRPNRRSAMRHRAANELRREGWAFVRRQEHYADLDDDERVRAFSEAIEDINFVVESIDETVVDAGEDTGG